MSPSTPPFGNRPLIFNQFLSINKTLLGCLLLLILSTIPHPTLRLFFPASRKTLLRPLFLASLTTPHQTRLTKSTFLSRLFLPTFLSSRLLLIPLTMPPSLTPFPSNNPFLSRLFSISTFPLSTPRSLQKAWLDPIFLKSTPQQIGSPIIRSLRKQLFLPFHVNKLPRKTTSRRTFLLDLLLFLLLIYLSFLHSLALPFQLNFQERPVNLSLSPSPPNSFPLLFLLTIHLYLRTLLFHSSLLYLSTLSNTRPTNLHLL